MIIHKNIIIAFTALCPFIVNAQNDITGTWHGTLPYHRRQSSG